MVMQSQNALCAVLATNAEDGLRIARSRCPVILFGRGMLLLDARNLWVIS